MLESLNLSRLISRVTTNRMLNRLTATAKSAYMAMATNSQIIHLTSHCDITLLSGLYCCDSDMLILVR